MHAKVQDRHGAAVGHEDRILGRRRAIRGADVRRHCEVRGLEEGRLKAAADLLDENAVVHGRPFGGTGLELHRGRVRDLEGEPLRRKRELVVCTPFGRWTRNELERVHAVGLVVAVVVALRRHHRTVDAPLLYDRSVQLAPSPRARRRAAGRTLQKATELRDRVRSEPDEEVLAKVGRRRFELQLRVQVQHVDRAVGVHVPTMDEVRVDPRDRVAARLQPRSDLQQVRKLRGHAIAECGALIGDSIPLACTRDRRQWGR